MTSLLSLALLIRLIDDRLMSAWQVYSAPCDVCRELNVSVLILVTPLTVVPLSVTPFPLPTLPPLHCTVGCVIRYSTTLTLHVNCNSSPAMLAVGPEIVTTGSGRSGGEEH